MPRKRVSDDMGHVPIDPKPSKVPKKAPPKQWDPPPFEPMAIDNPLTYGKAKLPPHIPIDSPYDIFSLFFTDEMLTILVENTNANAEATLLTSLSARLKIRQWQPTNVKEFKAYIGAYIWMGVYHSTRIDDFWNTDPLKGPIHAAVSQRIGLNRWQQIDRYFHISPLPESGVHQSPFEKLEPLNEHLRHAFKAYWDTGTHLAVDETIQRFMGRSKETVNIPSKPEPEGFKIWVLANSGYVLDWLYYAKGDKAGPVDLDTHWIQKGYSKTQGVVLDLLSQTGISNQMAHTVWLDNLFTSARLLTELKGLGFGAAGTVRTTKTVREDIEEASGTRQQKEKKEVNRGLDRSLSDPKLIHGAQLKWGMLYGVLSANKKVLEMAWKDQNVVFIMTTVDRACDTVWRMRRRPTATATNASTSRAEFGNEAVKEMDIPTFIDRYNHFMSGVDQADQLRSYYTTQRTHVKNWKPLWHFLLDTAIINAYKIAYVSPNRPHGEANKHVSHKQFRIRLATSLFDQSDRVPKLQALNQPMADSIVHVHEAVHGEITRLTSGEKNCVNCVSKKDLNSIKPRSKRLPLGQLAQGTVRVTKAQKGHPTWPKRYPKGVCYVVFISADEGTVGMSIYRAL